MKGKIASVAVMFILVLAFLPPSWASGFNFFAINQPLLPVVGKVCSIGQPASSGLRFDKGRSVFCFTDKGAMWVTKDNSNLNFSIFPSTVNLASRNFTLTKTLSRNSTTIDVRYSGSITVGATTYSATFDIILRNSSDAYTKKIFIIGSASVGGTIAIPFKNPNNLLISSTSTSYCIGGFCFDFSDASAFNPTIQNGALKFTVGTAFRIDPIWIDKSGTNNCSSGTTCAITLTTNAVNTLLIFTSMARRSTGHIIISSISDTASNTWSVRKQIKLDGANLGSKQYYLEEWKAYWTSSGSITITATYNGTIVSARDTAFAILGSDHANSDFDTASLPTSGTGTGSNPSITISTNNANDMIIGVLGGDTTAPSMTCATFPGGQTGAGYLLINGQNGGSTSCVEDTFTMSTVTNKAVNWVITDTAMKWAMIADAIMEAPVVTTTTVTTTSTQTLSSITRPDPTPVLIMGLGLMAVVAAFVFVRRR